MRTRNPQAGYALLLVVFLAALIMISMAVALPPVLHEGTREREQELIFRGEQYQRAIGLFYKKYGRYPNTIEELLRTNDRGFLRKEFPDPMTKHGKWRIIGLGPGGALQGSTQNPLGPGSGPGAQPGGSGGGTVGLGSGSKPPEQPKRETRSREEIARGSSIRSSSGQPSYPIAGVVSQSTKPSIRVYNGNSGYANWEFIYDPTKDPALVPAGATPGSGQPTPPQPPRQGGPGGVRRPQM